ncbi:MAG TPA: preprotein translocase subunit SecG [Blastocatellia bacterium]|nr:preprotein translocase subunit SecG [Blastocatellia bacterium]
MLQYILYPLFILSCLVLILFVLLQPGKSDAAQVFGGGASSTAFGPRGTQTVLAKITIGAAICFFIIAFLFSVPGLTEKQSLGEGAGPAQTSPPPPEPAPTVPEQATPPASSPDVTSQTGSNKNSNSANAKPGANKNAAPPAKPQSKQK